MATKLGQTGNLALATFVSMVNFWAWNVIGPMSSKLSDEMGLTASQSAVLVAMPVLVGSLGRIPVGALTDKFGGRVMFLAVSLASIIPVLAVGIFGNANQYVPLLASAFLLGIAGTVFTVGIPFVNSWYPPERRGFATGVFGAGMVGTAVSAFFTPRFVNIFGHIQTHVILAVLLAVTAVLVYFFLSDAPVWQPQTDPFFPKLWAAAKLPVTWNMCVLYGVVFGGFVAFSTYLPTYIKTIDLYDFDAIQAGTRTAAFALAAVVARPLGGMLSDKIQPKIVVLGSLAGTAVMAALVNIQPAPELQAGLVFGGLAFFLGIGTGGVFAWLSRLTPANRVGSVTGLVSAAGGLGGYFPPLVMGATYNAAGNNYHVGLILLVITAAVVFVYTFFLVPATDPTKRVSRDRKAINS
ncbi:nitrate/nitrite transporter [Tomitella biformata]|uniref:nitrate/nitrite transporter n=1 Tax=Tomitella biformata TaxID=630403 RepID=UPI000466FF1E|nr:MFS transporter [Tomitella biformata]